MKVADLLNEHGLKWFKYSSIFFGILWGIFGALLIINTNPAIGSIVVAMNIAFIIRDRLDYLNHQIAATIIILTGISFGQIVVLPFIIFFFIFLIFGSLKDSLGGVFKSKNFLSLANESMLYYPIPTLIYAMIYGDWLLFIVFTTYTLSYNLTKIIAYNKGYK